VPMRRYGTTLAAISIAAIALFLLGPAYLRHALSALLIVSRNVEAAAPYNIEVTPGNATVARGADQAITADAVDAFRTALDAAHVANELVTYPGAPHSFFDKRYEEHRDAGADAWRRILEFVGINESA